MKKCCVCKLQLPFDNFCKDKSRGDGLAYKCRSCQKVLSDRLKARKPDEVRERCRQATARHRARLTEAQKAEVRAKQNEALKLPSARGRCRENCRRYYATKHNATPKWLTKEQKQQIKDLYFLAKDCQITSGYPYHVDHIIPIKGKLVCGLHVPWNLQVVPADINVSKSNKLVV